MKSLLLLPLLVALAHSACPSEFESFVRPSGTWCMQIFPAASNVGYAQAQTLCKAKGGVLSGFESLAEMYLLYSVASLGEIKGSIWLGAKRTAACTGKKLSATCSQKTAFKWTDGVTTGSDGFKWLDKSQPDNAHGLTQNCIVAFMTQNNVVYKGVTWRPGAMDDVACDTAQFGTTGPRLVGGYLCGRKE